jgi:hypothetical protein
MKKINQEISKKCLTRGTCGGRLVFVADAAPAKLRKADQERGSEQSNLKMHLEK